jgi:hypothetical protein
VNVVRRHPFACLLALLVLLAATAPLPALVDAVTGAAPDADLSRPLAYVIFAPLSDAFDALTFLSLARAQALLITWAAGLALWGALRRGTVRERVRRALLGPVIVVLVASATVLLPRPVPALTVADSSVTVIDYHAHTDASHDGRTILGGWSVQDLARWHAAQGFAASYVTDHNIVFNRRITSPIVLLPGVEWSVYQQHIVALGETRLLDRTPYLADTPAMLKLFAVLHQQGALAIASIPEYWEHHREDLDQFVAAGVDGFEIVNCAPKAIGFAESARRDVIELAQTHDLLLTGASDNHGWGKVTCVWNLTHAGAKGFAANHVIARSLAMAQGTAAGWSAGVTQPWLMLRALSWSERASWLTWIALYLIYMSVPRRQGQHAGLGILARSL